MSLRATSAVVCHPPRLSRTLIAVRKTRPIQKGWGDRGTASCAARRRLQVSRPLADSKQLRHRAASLSIVALLFKHARKDRQTSATVKITYNEILSHAASV